jgi:hypothetical protein
LIYLKEKLFSTFSSLLPETTHYLESSDSQENWDADPNRRRIAHLMLKILWIMTTIKVNMPFPLCPFNIEPHHSTHKFPSLKY